MASNFQSPGRLLPLVFAVVLFAGPFTFAAPDEIPPDRLEQEIGNRLMRVPEFRYLRETAQGLGVRVYLFGGTAAAYAHYVNWDLKREAGDKSYQPDRFDYDFTNIYRSNQDLDIVVDGPSEAIARLQSNLQAIYPHLQGDKTAWEVRSLRESSGTKMAILGNPDFSNQHTDSNSVGMIEITPTTDHVVKDLREWEKPVPQFLRDVSNGQLHFYFSNEHESTARARSGLNPPILAAIRYLIKAVQFDVEMDPASLSRVKAIIEKWDPTLPADPYVKNWIDKNGIRARGQGRCHGAPCPSAGADRDGREVHAVCAGRP